MHSKECDMNPRNDFMAELSLGWRATTNRIEYRKWWVHVWALHTSQTSFPSISTLERDSDTFLHHPTDDTSSSRLSHHNFPTKQSRRWCEEEKANDTRIYLFTQHLRKMKRIKIKWGHGIVVVIVTSVLLLLQITQYIVLAGWAYNVDPKSQASAVSGDIELFSFFSVLCVK